MTDDTYIPNVVLSIHAHPDDQEFTVAGTLAKWAQAGTKVISIVVTSGDAGSNDLSMTDQDKPNLAKLRETEQLAACNLIGVQETVFLHYPDGILEPTLALRKDLTRFIRFYKPDSVMIGDPQSIFYGSGYINHPDHRAAAQAALYAVFPSAETRLIFADLLKDGLMPHKVQRLYIHGSEHPDCWIDITDTIQIKINALRKHASQLHDWDPEKMIKEWAGEDGKKSNLQFAESYKLMRFESEEEK